MGQLTRLCTGLGVGAGLMYFFDPQLGRRRRALWRDQLVSAKRRLDQGLETAVRDLRQRAQGVVAETTARLGRDDASDEVITARVRSKIGRCVSHPSSIEVQVNDGAVTLRGPVLAHEVDNLVAGVWAVRGVRDVRQELDIHKEPGNVAGLQGGSGRRGEASFDLLQQNWSPATRLIAGVAGCTLMANCLTRRTPLGVLLGPAGFGLVLRSITNTDLARLTGATGSRRAVDIQKTITIDKPVDQVFPFFSQYDTFPRFMSHIRDIRDLGDGRSHWVAEGPAGLRVRWDAVVTQYIPNELLAWRSEPGSIIANAGIIRFESQPNDRTRVDIRLSYNPPGGALGHFAARLFGADPKGLMDEDLVRLKGLIEEGKTSTPGKGESLRQDISASPGGSNE